MADRVGDTLGELGWGYGRRICAFSSRYYDGCWRILWASLRELKQIGLHFRRQAPFDKYIVDFCCHSAKLIVELDGGQHGSDDAIAYDALRTAYLNGRGYRVVRFANEEVQQDRARVVDAIVHDCRAPHPDFARAKSDLPARGR